MLNPINAYAAIYVNYYSLRNYKSYSEISIYLDNF